VVYQEQVIQEVDRLPWDQVTSLWSRECKSPRRERGSLVPRSVRSGVVRRVSNARPRADARARAAAIVACGLWFMVEKRKPLGLILAADSSLPCYVVNGLSRRACMEMTPSVSADTCLKPVSA
jgi:hypothetical protein